MRDLGLSLPRAVGVVGTDYSRTGVQRRQGCGRPSVGRPHRCARLRSDGFANPPRSRCRRYRRTRRPPRPARTPFRHRRPRLPIEG